MQEGKYLLLELLDIYEKGYVTVGNHVKSTTHYFKSESILKISM
jgi:hypothetical protein